MSSTPTGVSIYDPRRPESDRMRTDARYTVLEADGSVRELVLVLGRGKLVDAQPTRREE